MIKVQSEKFYYSGNQALKSIYELTKHIWIINLMPLKVV